MTTDEDVQASVTQRATWYGLTLTYIAGLLRAWWVAPIGVLVPVIALAIVLLAPQMPDMFAGMLGEGPGGRHDAWWILGRGFGFAASLLGLASWYWTRAALNGDIGRADADGPHGPRVVPCELEGHPSHLRAYLHGYKQAARWATLPALLLALSPVLLPVLRSDAELRAPDVYGALLALAAFVFAVGPFEVGRRGLVSVAAPEGPAMAEAAIANQASPLSDSRLTQWRHVRLFSPLAAAAPLVTWAVLAAIRPSPADLVLAAMLVICAAGAALLVKHGPKPKPFRVPTRFRPKALLVGAPLGWGTALAIVLAAVFAAVLMQVRPSLVAWSLHAPSAALVALALLIGPVTVALEFCRWAVPPYGAEERPPNYGIPSKRTLALFLLVLVIGAPSCVPGLDDTPGLYEVRTLPGGPPNRDDLSTALGKWREKVLACRAEAGVPLGPDEALPVIIAAAEGGASRAALWFLAGARELDRRTNGLFGTHLFAISGVSGGSLGAVTYVQALAAAPGGCGRVDWEKATKGLEALGYADFLAPAIAGYFLTDPLLRIGFPVRYVVPTKDRAVLLEDAFERHWVDSWGATAVTARGGVVALRRGMPEPAPHLFLNGTDVASGRRLMTSTVSLGEDRSFFNVDDLLAERFIGRDVPAATAVTNSARFPFISPAGRFPPDARLDELRPDECRRVPWWRKTFLPWAWPDRCEITRQVVDGGYFENYGARTAADIANAIQRAAGKRWKVRPIVIVFSNDADVPAAELGRTVVACGADEPVPVSGPEAQRLTASRNAASGAPATEFLAPVLGLTATRGAHGIDALEAIRRALCDPSGAAGGGTTPQADAASAASGVTASATPARPEGPGLIRIALPSPDPSMQQAAPMNWVLNDAAVRFLVHEAPCVDFNREQADQLAQSLRAKELARSWCPPRARDVIRPEAR